jgi:hypothetical protein
MCSVTEERDIDSGTKKGHKSVKAMRAVRAHSRRLGFQQMGKSALRTVFSSEAKSEMTTA